MIESTALFLTLSSLYLYAKIRLSSEWLEKSFQDIIVNYSLFFLVLLLGLLTKVTTILSSIALITFDLLINIVLSLPLFSKSSQLSKVDLFLCSICLITSFIVLKSWLVHADSLKSMNQIGQSLTSEALTNWNYGNLKQRIGRQLWGSVVIRRMMTPIGFVPGIFLIGTSISASFSKQRTFKIETAFILACIILWLAPLMLFANLHIVHTYYQCANQVFLLMALAASFSTAIEIVDNSQLKRLIPLSLCVFIAGSLIDFSYSSGYLKASFARDSNKLAVGRFVRENTPSESVLLVIGDDWSSAF